MHVVCTTEHSILVNSLLFFLSQILKYVKLTILLPVWDIMKWTIYYNKVWTIFIIDIGHTTSHGGKEDNFDNSSEGSCDVLDRYYNIPSLSSDFTTQWNVQHLTTKMVAALVKNHNYGITERNYKPFNLLDHLTKTIFWPTERQIHKHGREWWHY